MPNIIIHRDGNRIRISPPERRVHAALMPLLTYVEKVILRGKQAWEARDNDQPTMFDRTWECFGLDIKGRLCTNLGFLDVIQACCKKRGWPVSVVDRTKYPRPDAFTPFWPRVADFKFRPGQREILELMTRFPDGRIDCPTGWGKSWLMAAAATLFYKAKIVLTADSVDVVRDRLFSEVAQIVPNTGVIGGGKKRLGRRVMCVTFDSLHHADPDADFVFVDEGHQAAADKVANNLGRFEHAHLWSFSASWDMRLDNKNKRCEAMFGPIRFRLSYEEAVEQKIVVPIEVIWEDVISDVDPCAGIDDTVTRKRLGYWRHTYRNKKIRRAARRYGKDTQVLITVETVEHALRLQRLLPEFTLVHGPINGQQLRRFRRRKILPEDFKECTPERRELLTKRFERGKLKKVIATTVWNVGVNFRNLQVLIRADGGASPIGDTQIPGRTSRPGLAGSDKQFGIIHDFRDQFNSSCERRAKGRERSYRKLKWKQHYPGKRRRQLAQRLRWKELE